MLRWILGSGRKAILQTDTVDDSSSSLTSKSSSDEEPEPEDVEDEGSIELETWLDWFRRTTRTAEGFLRKCGLDDWVITQRRGKWRWAGHLARRTDFRWNTRLLDFVPAEGCRQRGHPCKRWSSDLEAFFSANGCSDKGFWKHVAQSRETWASLEDEFANRSWYA